MPELKFEAFLLVEPMTYRKSDLGKLNLGLDGLSSKRRDIWDSHQEADKFFKSRPAFSAWDPRVLDKNPVETNTKEQMVTGQQAGNAVGEMRGRPGERIPSAVPIYVDSMWTGVVSSNTVRLSIKRPKNLEGSRRDTEHDRCSGCKMVVVDAP